MQRIALTTGEPAGIGPDLTIMLAQQARAFEIVAIGNKQLLMQRAEQLSLPLQLRDVNFNDAPSADAASSLCVLDVDLNNAVNAGSLNPANAPYVLSTLDIAYEGCEDQRFDAMVTAPVHKGVINDAGFPFTGHTEYLAAKSRSTPVMLLASGDFRVALATTHLPLSDVSAAINEADLMRVLTVLHTELQHRFAISQPRILVCGLNPHAGEDGHLGREEIDVIQPALQRANEQGIQAVGPLPADTLFTEPHLKKADAVLAMFHDQGLPVLKYAGFGNAVNITLGLPIIRTSVDHGTALDKAGTGDIHSGSLNAAISTAQQMIISSSAGNQLGRQHKKPAGMQNDNRRSQSN